jgi:DNA-binding transcriptional LysR family regulator
MAMSLDDLRVFQAVADAGSFSRAAARLRLSQPSVSERVARLERDLGRRLFTRSARGVRLTAAGERLLPYSERCLVLIEEAVAAVRAEPVRARVRVAMHASFAPTVLPLVLDALTPLEVVCTDAHSEQIVRQLVDDEVDIGLIVPTPHPATITTQPFLSDRVICATHPDDPLLVAPLADLRVEDLARYPVAYTPWGTGATAFLDRLRAADGRHQHATPEAALALARRGTHIAVVPRSLAAPDLRAGMLVTLPVRDFPDWRLCLDLAYRVDRADWAPLRTLRNTQL